LQLTWFGRGFRESPLCVFTLAFSQLDPTPTIHKEILFDGLSAELHDEKSIPIRFGELPSIRQGNRATGSNYGFLALFICCNSDYCRKYRCGQRCFQSPFTAK